MPQDLLLLESDPKSCTRDCCADNVVSGVVDEAIELVDDLNRRRFLGGALALGAAGAILAACGDDDETQPEGAKTDSTPVTAKIEKMDIAFCSQILCGLPFQVAIEQGFFKEQGFDINLVYMKGGAVAMNALLSKSIDWVGTPLDLVVSAWGSGKEAVMVGSTASLPFFALVAGPGSGINTLSDLKGKKIGINNQNTTDHLLSRYLLSRAGIKDDQVTYVPMGANLYDGLIRKQVDAGMVQEPSLTLTERAGGKVLVNLMKRSDAQSYLGGPYQFMGLNTRPDVIQAKPDYPARLVKALTKANQWIRTHSGAEVVKNVPAELVAGGDDEVFASALDKVKNDLYPDNAKVDAASAQRVVDVQKLSGALEQEIKVDTLYTNQYAS